MADTYRCSLRPFNMGNVNQTERLQGGSTPAMEKSHELPGRHSFAAFNQINIVEAGHYLLKVACVKYEEDKILPICDRTSRTRV